VVVQVVGIIAAEPEGDAMAEHVDRIEVGDRPSYFFQVEGSRLTDPGLAADIRDRHSICTLFQIIAPQRMKRVAPQ